jgi:hypothetical protein
MKLASYTFALIILSLVSGCLGNGGIEDLPTTTINTKCDGDPQVCDPPEGYETGEKETNITASNVITTLPIRTATTLHPSQSGPSEGTNNPVKFEALVYKDSATCRCCDKYFDYFEGKGVGLEVIETDDMASIYSKYNIHHDMQSCHTILLDGYFIEGHVPMEAIEKLLSEKPEIDGITLPGKPYGAPGMRGAKTGELIIYALSDGEASVFYKW